MQSGKNVSTCFWMTWLCTVVVSGDTNNEQQMNKQVLWRPVWHSPTNTCPASLLSASSCLLLISGVPGQLPPPPSSPPPPLPRESWERATGSTSGISVNTLYTQTQSLFAASLFIRHSNSFGVSLCPTAWLKGVFLLVGSALYLVSASDTDGFYWVMWDDSAIS